MTDPRARTVVDRLSRAQQTVACAESLTGGMVAAALTSVPGASSCFRGGVVAYATDVKQQVLGVPAAVVAEHGVVSAECAAAMAAGARELLGTTWAVATTGVAGPDRQEGKPAGTVFVAAAGPGVLRTRPLTLTGDRTAVRSAARDAALDLLGETLEGDVQETLAQD